MNHELKDANTTILNCCKFQLPQLDTGTEYNSPQSYGFHESRIEKTQIAKNSNPRA